MKINYKESQIDFLSNVSGAGQDSPSPRYMAAQVSLSLENLVILSILTIMLLIFSFSMGIERGKRVALAAPASTSDAVIPVTAAAAAATVQKANKGSEKIEDKDNAQKAKDVLISSQLLVKNKVVPAVVNVINAAGGYTLQVASYKGEKFAKLEADKLKQKGFNNVYVLAKGAYTIVCVGNFQKKEDASDVKRQLKSRYQDFVVRRL